MTIEYALKEISGRLIDSGYVHGEREAGIFLSELLDKDTAWIFSHQDEPVSDQTLQQLHQWVDDRLKGKPVAYITGHQNFMGWDFVSDERGLIPRPETEYLVEQLVRFIRKEKLEQGNFLEIGTGSGIISIALKKFFPDAKITATDVSEEAIDLAEENAKRHKVDIDFIVSDLFKNAPKEKYNLVVANLPYVPTTKLSFVSDQILDWEPMIAIEAGEDGLLYIKPLLEAAKPFLADDGTIALEFWHTHGEPVKQLTDLHLPTHEVEVEKDLAGFDRYAFIRTKRN
jgi:release factor glutamine methyltransferase